MNNQKQRRKLEKMLRKCPDVLTPMKAAKWMPIGKNAVYAAIKSGEIESFVYKGGYIITKDSVIDYLIKTADRKGRTFTIRGDKSAK